MSKKIIASSIIIVLIFTITFSFMRLSNGVNISARGREDISYPITLFRQDDMLWQNDKLGTSDYIMKKSGCVTSCIATALSQNMNEITPGELNRIFSENSVYDANGNLQWKKLESLGYQTEVLSTVSEAEIYTYLKNCQFPIIRVRVNGFGSFHYVLIVGIEKGEYICMDPLKDHLVPLSSYWSRVYAVRVIY